MKLFSVHSVQLNCIYIVNIQIYSIIYRTYIRLIWNKSKNQKFELKAEVICPVGNPIFLAHIWILLSYSVSKNFVRHQNIPTYCTVHYSSFTIFQLRRLLVWEVSWFSFVCCENVNKQMSNITKNQKVKTFPTIMAEILRCKYW